MAVTEGSPPGTSVADADDRKAGGAVVPIPDSDTAQNEAGSDSGSKQSEDGQSFLVRTC